MLTFSKGRGTGHLNRRYEILYEFKRASGSGT